MNEDLDRAKSRKKNFSKFIRLHLETYAEKNASWWATSGKIKKNINVKRNLFI